MAQKQDRNKTTQQNGDKTTSNHNQSDQPYRREFYKGFGSFYFGLLFILIGTMMLASRWGLITFQLANLWTAALPLLIIGVGLAMIKVRSGFYWTLIALIITLGLGLVLAFSGLQERPERAIRTVPIDMALEADEANLLLEFGGGNLTIGALETDSDRLAAGQIRSSAIEVRTDSETIDGLQLATISSDTRQSHVWLDWYPGRSNRLDLELNPNIPLAIEIDSGASNLNLDLRQLIISSLMIDSGASNVNVRLGDKATNSDVRVDSGASSVSITLHRTAGAAIEFDGGLSSRSFEGFDRVGDNRYQTENYDQAEQRINISLNAGVSSVTVRRAD